jgi:cytochrome oxidase Cu insertion factor (SCO1/SenC/PrrC family)
MVTVFIRHKVKDYAVWKKGYDSTDGLRKSFGISYASVHHADSDPNDVIVVHQFKDLATAQKFMAGLPDLMDEIGVIGKPDIWFGEDLERVSYW